uniref:Carbamoyl phosphate synthase small chain n=1 Tax=Centroceras clavulatum TaxID=159503 RepID=A0A4D6WRT4_9FLOR|nr:Carbamoyl phosphate synthase small subunit [Centroceras clavulatum]
MSINICESTLLLEDGSKYQGWSFFDKFKAIGEIVFNTGMTGYQEIITDPSYYGQIMTFTYPEIGNTGLNNQDYESSAIHIKGIVAKEICAYPSNWRSNFSLPEYLKKYNIPHIFGIDTRALTKHLRKYGVMQAIISSGYAQDILCQCLQNYPKINFINLSNYVTVDKTYYINNFRHFNNKLFNYSSLKTSNKDYKFNIVLLDFGVKYNIIRRLLSYGCNVYLLPSTSTYETIASYKPNGILLSNGPGNPEELKFAINTVKQILFFANIPIFGICMGHQILNIALEAKTFKLKFGHRGLNHPSGDVQISEITSQNHGFAVCIDSYIKFKNLIQVTHFNLNDLTLAGIRHLTKPIFSVQYHPEASPGPHDSDYLFKYFMELMLITKK